MTPNQIQSAKERINFLSRTLMVYVAGVYLLFGAAGNYFLEWLEREEIVWRNFAVALVAAVVGFAILSLIGAIVYRAISNHITQIGKAP